MALAYLCKGLTVRQVTLTQTCVKIILFSRQTVCSTEKLRKDYYIFFLSFFRSSARSLTLSRIETAFGIRSTALQWFRSYLLDRNQCWLSTVLLPLRLFSCLVLGPVLFVLYTTPLSDIIASHSLNHQLFADNTQLQKSTPPNDVQSLTHDLQSCTDDIKAWLCNNQLKRNED